MWNSPATVSNKVSVLSTFLRWRTADSDMTEELPAELNIFLSIMNLFLSCLALSSVNVIRNKSVGVVLQRL